MSNIIIKKVALAGGSGNLGKLVLDHLLAANFDVTVLVRENSTSVLPNGVKTAKVEYDSEESLTAALQGQDALVSTTATEATFSQDNLIKAAISARVYRIIPSEFVSDTSLEANKVLPVYFPKLATQKLLEEGVKDTDGAVTYTLVMNNVFLDWGIASGFLIDAKNKSIVLHDGGETQYSATPLHTVAKGVVGVLQHPEETANRAVRIQGTVLTQKRLLELGKKALDGEGWTVSENSTSDDLQKGWEVFKSDPGNVMGWMMKLLISVAFSSQHTPKFAQVDNVLLGVPETEDEEIIRYIKEAASV